MPKGGRLRGKKADGESTGGPAGSLIKVKDLRAADRRFQQIPVVTLEALKAAATRQAHPPGTVVCRTGKANLMTFYLFKGSVTLYTGLGDDDVTVKQGQVFGEDAMLVSSGNLQVTAVTKEHTTAVVLHKEHLEAALHMGERERQVYLPDDARIALMTPPKERTDQHMAALAAALELKPLFAKMPPHVRQRALQHVTLQRFDSQECLVSQGTTSNVLYMLLDGSVSTHVLENWRVDRQDSESDSSEYSSEYSTDEDDRDDDSRPSSRNNNTRRSVSPSARAGGSMSDIKRMMSRAGSMKALEDEGAASSGIDLIDRYGECVTVLFANDVLGEMALGEEEKHTMSAVTREPTEALLLPVSTLRAAVEERPFPLELERVKRLLARRPADRREDELRELLPLLEYCPYLRTLAPHVRMAVCSALEYKELHPGALLLKAGQKPTAMALVLSGELAVHKTKTALGDEEEPVLNELGMDLRAPEDWRWWGDCQSLVLPGICVNEVSISKGHGQPSPTTTTALSPVGLMVLNKAAYTLVLRRVEEEVNLSKLKMLRKVPALNQLTGRSLERIVRCMHTKYPKPGEVIFQQGVTPTHAFLLRAGKCVSERRPRTGEREMMRVEEALEEDGQQAEAADITEHSPGEMLGLRELVFKAPYTMTMRCVEPHTEVLVVAGDDLTRHSKGILHGLHAFEPPVGATIHPPFSAAARAAAEAKEEAVREERSPTKTPVAGSGGGGWALTALDSESGRSPSPPRGGGTPPGPRAVAVSPVGSHASSAVTPTHLHGDRELLPRVDTPQSWLSSEFSMTTKTTTMASSVRPDSPDRVTVMTEENSAAPERRARPPTAYAIRQAAKEEREAKEAARAIAITSTQQQPFTWRSHLEMLQSKVQRVGASYPGRPAARSGKGTYPTLPFPHVLRPTTAPINIGGEWLDPKAPGSPTYRARPSTAEAFANLADARPGTAAAAAAAGGVRPGTVGAAMGGVMGEVSGQEEEDHDEEDLVAILERRALAKKKRSERSKAESPRSNKYNAAGVTQTRFFQELQKEKVKRRSRRMGRDGAAALDYARIKLGVEPSVDPELAFMAQVAWAHKNQPVDPDSMPDIAQHLQPDPPPTAVQVNAVRHTREYYWQHTNLGPLRGKRDEYVRPRRLWENTMAHQKKYESFNANMPPVPKANAVCHLILANDFHAERTQKSQKAGSGSMRLLAHLREDMPFSRYDSPEKAVMTFGRTMMRRKAEDARKNSGGTLGDIREF